MQTSIMTVSQAVYIVFVHCQSKTALIDADAIQKYLQTQKKKSIQMKMYKYEMNEGGNYSLHIILFLLLTCVFFL